MRYSRLQLGNGAGQLNGSFNVAFFALPDVIHIRKMDGHNTVPDLIFAHRHMIGVDLITAREILQGLRQLIKEDRIGLAGSIFPETACREGIFQPEFQAIAIAQRSSGQFVPGMPAVVLILSLLGFGFCDIPSEIHAIGIDFHIRIRIPRFVRVGGVGVVDDLYARGRIVGRGGLLIGL